MISKHLDLHVIGITFIPFLFVAMPIVSQFIPGYWPLLIVAVFPQGRILMRSMDLKAGNKGADLTPHLLVNESVVAIFMLANTALLYARL